MSRALQLGSGVIFMLVALVPSIICIELEGCDAFVPLMLQSDQHSCVFSSFRNSLANFLVCSERIGKIPGVKRLCKWNLQLCGVLKIIALTENV